MAAISRWKREDTCFRNTRRPDLVRAVLAVTDAGLDVSHIHDLDYLSGGPQHPGHTWLRGFLGYRSSGRASGSTTALPGSKRGWRRCRAKSRTGVNGPGLGDGDVPPQRSPANNVAAPLWDTNRDHRGMDPQSGGLRFRPRLGRGRGRRCEGGWLALRLGAAAVEDGDAQRFNWTKGTGGAWKRSPVRWGRGWWIGPGSSPHWRARSSRAAFD